MNVFAKHVTSTAFSLSLSRSMVNAMIDLKCRQKGAPHALVNSASYQSLELRGLLYRDPKVDLLSSIPELSVAGEAVFNLLILAELISPEVQSFLRENKAA